MCTIHPTEWSNIVEPMVLHIWTRMVSMSLLTYTQPDAVLELLRDQKINLKQKVYGIVLNEFF